MPSSPPAATFNTTVEGSISVVTPGLKTGFIAAVAADLNEQVPPDAAASCDIEFDGLTLQFQRTGQVDFSGSGRAKSVEAAKELARLLADKDSNVGAFVRANNLSAHAHEIRMDGFGDHPEAKELVKIESITTARADSAPSPVC